MLKGMKVSISLVLSLLSFWTLISTFKNSFKKLTYQFVLTLQTGQLVCNQPCYSNIKYV